MYVSEAAIAKTGFSKLFERKVMSRPAGDEPQLARRLKVKTSKSGLHGVTFTTKEGKDISISLNNQHLHSFCYLRAKAVENTKCSLVIETRDKFQAPHTAPEQIK